MQSFRQLCELSAGRDFWDHKSSDRSRLDDESLTIIQRGLEARPDRTDGHTFWDDFISVIGNNSDGAAKLFNVNRDVVSGWSAKIKEGLKRIRDEEKSDDKGQMAQTGSDR